MFRSERFFADFECALIERFRFGIVAHVVIKIRQIVEALCGIGMIWAQCFLPNLERALIERLGLGVVAYGVIKRRQIVEALGCMRIISP